MSLDCRLLDFSIWQLQLLSVLPTLLINKDSNFEGMPMLYQNGQFLTGKFHIWEKMDKVGHTDFVRPPIIYIYHSKNC